MVDIKDAAFKIGDKVRIVKERHKYANEICTIKNIMIAKDVFDHERILYEVLMEIDEEFGFVNFPVYYEESLEPLKELTLDDAKFKVGDRFRIKAKGYKYDKEEGVILTRSISKDVLTRENRIQYQVHLMNNPSGSDCPHHYYEDSLNEVKTIPGREDSLEKYLPKEKAINTYGSFFDN